MQNYYNKTLLLLLLFAAFAATAQPNRDRYRDKVWIFGSYSWPNYTLTFNEDGSTDTLTYIRNMPISAVSTSLCDTAGNLIAYSNGIYIADKTQQKMMNGDSIGYGAFWEYYRNTGSRALQAGAMMLPVGCSNQCNTMIYPYFVQLPNGSFQCKGIDFSTIDLLGNNNKGVVTQKDIPLLRDSTRGLLMTACRHANGRDWWFIAPSRRLQRYHRVLLSPSGAAILPPQTMPYQDANFGSIAKFTPDGHRYAHHDPILGTYLYDFDRCTGEVSNRQLIPLARAYRTPFCGIEFSPNSQYLYVTSDTSIVQYDLNAANIPASGIVVANYDGFADRGVFNTAFFLLQLAPNNKIYGACTGSNRYLHIIHNPDERGLACNVAQHDLHLPASYSSTMPNFPNFRLGAERGTVCDSLGIETGVTISTTASPRPAESGESLRLAVFPNPADSETSIALPEAAGLMLRGTLYVYDAMGRTVGSFQNPFLTQTSFTLNLKNYAKGIYYMQYIDDSGKRARARLARQ